MPPPPPRRLVTGFYKPSRRDAGTTRADEHFRGTRLARRTTEDTIIERFEAKMTVLEELIEHHVEEEEEEEEMFKAAARLGNARLEDLADEMEGAGAAGAGDVRADETEADAGDEDAEDEDEHEPPDVASPARAARGGGRHGRR